MSKVDQDTASLREEAKRLYQEYGETRAQYRQDRTNAELKQALERIRARYGEIKSRLGESNGALEAPDAQGGLPQLDMRQFEVKEFSIRRPVLAANAGADRRERIQKLVRIARYVFASVLLAGLAWILLQISNQRLGFYATASRSMEPTLKAGDRLVAYAEPAYARGDIVVLRDPRNPEEFLVKRIVGLAGDRISARNARLYVNDFPVREPYILDTIRYRMPPFRVGEGEVFVLGDNRNQSEDSHLWRRGVPLDAIMGRVRYIYSPAARRGSLPSYAYVFGGSS